MYLLHLFTWKIFRNKSCGIKKRRMIRNLSIAKKRKILVQRIINELLVY